MNTVQHMIHDTSWPGGVLHLTLREGSQALPPESPAKLTERLMEEVSLRATMVGPVLEGILHEGQGQPRWGINE